MAGKGAIREAADRVSERVAAFYEEMLDAEKTVRVECSHCGRKNDAVVPDWNARSKAIETLLSYGYGRPGTQRDEGAEVSEALGRGVEELSPDERRVILLEARRRVQAPGPSGGDAA